MAYCTRFLRDGFAENLPENFLTQVYHTILLLLKNQRENSGEQAIIEFDCLTILVTETFLRKVVSIEWLKMVFDNIILCP